MALLSPGVETRETSTQTTVVNSATGTAALVGDFNWGPAFQISQVTSENDLVSRFSTPTHRNADSFFSATNFLKYGNDLRLVRVVDEDTAKNASAMHDMLTCTITNGGSGYVVGGSITIKARFAGEDSDTDAGTGVITEVTSAQGISKYWLKTEILVGLLKDRGMYPMPSEGGPTITVTADTTDGGTNASLTDPKLRTDSGIYFPNDSESVAALTATGEDKFSGLCTAAILPAISARFPGEMGNDLTVEIMSYKTWTTPVAATDGGAKIEGVYDLPVYPYGNMVHVNMNDSIAYGPQSEHEFCMVVRKDGEQVEAVVLSTEEGARDIYGNNIYVGDYFELGRSKYISGVSNSWPKDFSGILALGGGTGGDYTPADSASLTEEELRAAAASKYIAPYIKGWDFFADRSNVNVNLLIAGSVAGLGDEEAATIQKYVSDLATARQDCVAFISPPKEKVLNIPAATAVDNMIAWRRGKTASGTAVENNMNINSTYAFIDGNYKYQYDKYNDVNRWVPLAADIAGLCVRTDSVSQPWMSPAGFNRGQVQGVIKLAVDTRQAHRDRLYQEAINPVVSFAGQGVVLYGDKMATSKPSPFDRINVRRLFNLVKTSISRSSQYHLFELNDAFTQLNFRSETTAYLNRIKSLGGIYDFRVVCDSSNNTPDVIDRNEFVAGMYIKPARSINYIYLNFVATSTGADFDELIGTV